MSLARFESGGETAGGLESPSGERKISGIANSVSSTVGRGLRFQRESEDISGQDISTPQQHQRSKNFVRKQNPLIAFTSRTEGDLGTDEEAKPKRGLGKKKLSKFYKKKTDDSDGEGEDVPRGFLGRIRILADPVHSPMMNSPRMKNSPKPVSKESPSDSFNLDTWKLVETASSKPELQQGSTSDDFVKFKDRTDTTERLGERARVNEASRPPQLTRLSGVVSPRVSGSVKSSNSVIFKQLSPELAAPLSPRRVAQGMSFSSFDLNKPSDSSDNIISSSRQNSQLALTTSSDSTPPSSKGGIALPKENSFVELSGRPSLSSVRSSGTVTSPDRRDVRRAKPTASFLVTSPTLSAYGSHLSDEPDGRQIVSCSLDDTTPLNSVGDELGSKRTLRVFRHRASSNRESTAELSGADDVYNDFESRKKYGVLVRVKSRFRM